VIIDGAADGETTRRHDVTFPLLTLQHGKDCVHFSTGFFQKENIVYAGILQIFIRITYEILRTLLWMRDGISFGKILPKQVGYFVT
jgi:hypothetical protein